MDMRRKERVRERGQKKYKGEAKSTLVSWLVLLLTGKKKLITVIINYYITFKSPLYKISYTNRLLLD